MFLRFLLLLLLALNLGVAAWLIFGDARPPMPPVTAAGVPELQLLSEVADAPSGGRGAQGSTPRTTPGKGEQCHALGPFATEAGMRQAMDQLAEHVTAIQFRTEQATKSRGWWVYLPSLPSRDRALDAARKLARIGVRDYYVITAGNHENTISLGLYRNRDNAVRRRTTIKAMGFAPAMRERTEQVLQYFIDYAMPAHQTLHWKNHLQAARGLHSEKRDCF